MGLLQLTVYKNPDFTQQLMETYIDWIAFGMNSTFNSVFATKQMYFSAKINGRLTCQASDTYKIYLVSNRKAEMYMNNNLIINKTQDVESMRYITDLFNDVFYEIEIRIIVDEKVPQENKPYINLRWESQNLVYMDIKPRNFYAVNPLSTNGGHNFTVLAGTANGLNSTVVDTTQGITGTEYDETRRLNYKIIPNTQSITGYVTIHDIYGNLRGPNGETQDNVKARIFKNWVLQSTSTLSQDSTTYQYAYSFSVTDADYYQVDILLDDTALDINMFTRDLKYKVEA